MKHYGDITKINGADLPPVDVITGGSPCQDLSIAGKREGLAGERSGLFMEQIRIVKEMREHDRSNGRAADLIRPRYMVWENVPGAFSSNGGKDFQAVLTEIIRITEPDAPDVPLPEKSKWNKSGCIYDGIHGRWSLAWRVHDAQFWGVPQRRKRIALIADFGGLSAPEILFERQGMRWHPEEGEDQGQGSAERTGGGTLGAIGIDGYNHTLTGNKAMTLTGSASDPHHIPSVISLQGNGIDRADNAGCNGKGWNDQDVSYTLNTLDRHAVYRKKRHPMSAEDGHGWERTSLADTLNVFDNSESRTPTIVFESGSSTRVGGHVYTDGITGTLRAGAGDNAQAVHVYENHASDSRIRELDGVCETVSQKYGTGGNNQPLILEECDGVCNASNRPIQGNGQGISSENEGSQRCNGSDFEGGVRDE